MKRDASMWVTGGLALTEEFEHSSKHRPSAFGGGLLLFEPGNYFQPVSASIARDRILLFLERHSLLPLLYCGDANVPEDAPRHCRHGFWVFDSDNDSDLGGVHPNVLAFCVKRRNRA